MAMETETVMETVNIKEMNKQKLQNQMTLELFNYSPCKPVYDPLST